MRSCTKTWHGTCHALPSRIKNLLFPTYSRLTAKLCKAGTTECLFVEWRTVLGIGKPWSPSSAPCTCSVVRDNIVKLKVQVWEWCLSSSEDARWNRLMR